MADFLRSKCHLVLFHWRNNPKIALYPLSVVIVNVILNHPNKLLLGSKPLAIKHYTEKGLPPTDAEALFEKENSEYQFFISARILSLASSTFMRERIKVMMASSTKGITRYMSFSILMQDSGCTASALS